MLTIQTAAGTKLQFGIFVLVVFSGHVFDMFQAFFVKSYFEAAGTAVQTTISQQIYIACHNNP
jgi:hypothetical protein